MLSSSLYRSLSTDPGVYLFLNKENEVIYVGKAINLKKRVSSYFTKNDLGEKTRMLVSQINAVKTIKVESEIESLLLEANLIKKYKPKYNIKLTDGKAYPLIRITIKDKYPKVLVARRPDDPKSLYYGPFPNTGAMRLVLKTIRRIFPYQSVINHPNRPCLYYHLGLCPCPSVFEDGHYKKTIRHIIKFLEGKTENVLKDLENERDSSSSNLEFEEAARVQKQIDSIKLITSKFYKPSEYEMNPNLREDIRTQELLELKEELNRNGVGVKNLSRIECYDISNTSGKNATASMVVFKNGEKESASYRRFRIRGFYNGKPNDFAMMQEVIRRRLKHDDWESPDLIVVDGGKGQISSALEALTEEGRIIPLVGLAKREEIIITSDFRQIKLPRDSKQLHLVMRIRDEAHRFAITYHKKLRSKNSYI